MGAVLKQCCNLTHEPGEEWRGEGIHRIQSRYETQGKLFALVDFDLLGTPIHNPVFQYTAARVKLEFGLTITAFVAPPGNNTSTTNSGAACRCPSGPRAVVRRAWLIHTTSGAISSSSAKITPGARFASPPQSAYPKHRALQISSRTPAGGASGVVVICTTLRQ